MYTCQQQTKNSHTTSMLTPVEKILTDHSKTLKHCWHFLFEFRIQETHIFIHHREIILNTNSYAITSKQKSSLNLLTYV